MKRSIKRMLALALCLVLCATLLPGWASAAEIVDSGTCGENLTWTLDSEGTLTISGTGEMEDYIRAKDVPWYNSTSEIIKVMINDGVKTVGRNAFTFCEFLTDVSLPRGLTKIGDSAFSYCEQLHTINIPDELIMIDDSAFKSCDDLLEVILPDDLNSIGKMAFSGSGLTTITIPKGVTEIGDGAFCFCRKLTELNVVAGNSNYFVENGALFNYAMTELLWFPYRGTSKYTIPDGVTTIRPYCFYYSNIEEISIPNSVAIIGSDAFWGTKLTSVRIPKSVTEIGSSAFNNCDVLIDIEVDNGNPVYSSFSGMLFSQDLTTLICCPGGKPSCEIPDSVVNIAEYAFYFCDALTEVTMGNQVSIIGRYAFANCNQLEVITFGTGITSIGWSAFFGCRALKDVYYLGSQEQWETVTIEDANDSLFQAEIHYESESPGSILFGSCGDDLTWSLSPTATQNGSGGYWTLTISGTGKMYDYDYSKVPWRARRNGIKEVAFLGDVKTIGDNAFSDCNALTDISLPNNLTSIGKRAFSGCEKLETIDLPQQLLEIGESAFFGCRSLVSIIVPKAVKTIESLTFGRCWNLVSVTIPDGVTVIGKEAFYDCYKLETINLPESLERIGDRVFDGCECISSIKIPSNVRYIETGAFFNCKKLTSIEVDPNNAFYCSDDGVIFNKEKDTLITYPWGKQGTYVVPNSIERIEKCAFQGCEGLTDVTLSDGLKAIGKLAFWRCTGLTNIVLPNSVTYIGQEAFSCCSNLSEVTMSSTIRIVESDAFDLTEIYDNNSNWSNGVLYIGPALIKAKEDISGAYTIRPGTTVIAENSFSHSKLTSVKFPESLSIIGINSFKECKSLKRVIIPSSIKEIDYMAFDQCTNITDIYYAGSMSEWNNVKIDVVSSYYFSSATKHYDYSGPDIKLEPTVGTSAGTPVINLSLTGPEDLETMTVYGVRYSAEDQLLGLVSTEVQAGETGELTVPFADGSYIRFFALDAADQSPLCASVRVDRPA